MNKPNNIRSTIQNGLNKHAVACRIACCVLSVLLGFVFIEYTWNSYAFDLGAHYFIPNLLMLSVVFLVIYFLGQQSKLSILVFWTICLVMGIADHYLVEFKGQPVVPADVLALHTALEVSGGYDFTPSERMLKSMLLFALASLSLILVPKVKLNAKLCTANLALGAVLLVGSCAYIAEGDIENDFDCVVGEWNTLWYYEHQGTTLCFLKRVQDFFPDAPLGYSSQVALSLLDDEKLESGDETMGEGETRQPNIIIVMNESFADIGKLPSVEASEFLLPEYYRLASESVQSGVAYASCFGAGTCNSEFEVVTGASMANLGENVYPYVLYDLAHNENLVTFLEAMGYETTAMHPADAQNWRRDRVYEALGFDEFLTITDFDDAEKLRGFTVDSETYARSIEIIEQCEAPQFILDITIQNHGGYTSGLIPEDYLPQITANEQDYLALSEYAACAYRSDADLGQFLTQLDELDEDVIVLFFCDHQPSLGDIPIEEIYGKSAEDMSLEELQLMYEVPYLIWANYDTEAGIGGKLDTSLNYLGMNLIKAANLPLSPYLEFLSAAQQIVPALNQNGFMTSDGIWHSYGIADADAAKADEDEAVALALETLVNYSIVQFANLFDAQACSEMLVM